MSRLARLALALPICAAMVAPAQASQSYFDFSFSAEFTQGAYAGTYVISGQTAPGENQAELVSSPSNSPSTNYNVSAASLSVTHNGAPLSVTSLAGQKVRRTVTTTLSVSPRFGCMRRLRPIEFAGSGMSA